MEIPTYRVSREKSKKPAKHENITFSKPLATLDLSPLVPSSLSLTDKEVSENIEPIKEEIEELAETDMAASVESTTKDLATSLQGLGYKIDEYHQVTTADGTPEAVYLTASNDEGDKVFVEVDEEGYSIENPDNLTTLSRSDTVPNTPLLAEFKGEKAEMIMPCQGGVCILGAQKPVSYCKENCAVGQPTGRIIPLIPLSVILKEKRNVVKRIINLEMIIERKILKAYNVYMKRLQNQMRALQILQNNVANELSITTQLTGRSLVRLHEAHKVILSKPVPLNDRDKKGINMVRKGVRDRHDYMVSLANDLGRLANNSFIPSFEEDLIALHKLMKDHNKVATK